MLIRFTFDGVAGADELFNPNAAKFCAKNLVKLLHSGSNPFQYFVFLYKQNERKYQNDDVV